MFAAGLLGAVFGAGGTLAYFELVAQPRGGVAVTPRAAPTASTTVSPPAKLAATPTRGPSPTSPLPSAAMEAYHRMSRFGLPSNDTVFIKEGYVSSFDTARRIPRWVMEIITMQTIEAKEVKRDNSKFYSNTEIPEQFRATNGDYACGRGMSRGHLAPAQFHRDSQTAMDSTFDLSLNAVPQDMASNASDWMRVEMLCKKLAKEFERLYVVTGPLYIPKQVPGVRPRDPPRRVVEYEVLGTHDVAVPTHLFKAVLGERADGSAAFAGFVVPNAPVPDERPLTAFLAPKADIERWSGLTLFPHAPGSAKLPEICAKHKCEASAGGLGSTYRAVARLRAAPNRHALEQEWTSIVAAKHGTKIEEQVAKEYEHQKQALGG
jgi:DNA/RNA endonuclease G (NUC1)